MIFLVIVYFLAGISVGCILCHVLVVRPLLRLQEPRCDVPDSRVDRSDVRPLPTPPRAVQTGYSPEALRAIAYWIPPRDGNLEVIASVHLDERFLFYRVKPSDLADEISWNLDAIAHCLLATENPHLSDEWVQELEVFGAKFEEGITQ